MVAHRDLQQVRRPIFKEAWISGHFEPRLGPLKAVLGELANG
jgi:hypothetical protein